MNHTPNYNLSQWEAEDKVLRTDFNADNAKIDAAIKAVDQKADGKADKTALSALSGRVDQGLRMAVGSYVGTGECTLSLNFSQSLGRPPKVLVIHKGSGNSTYVWENYGSTIVTFNGNFPYQVHNEEGDRYSYFALG